MITARPGWMPFSLSRRVAPSFTDAMTSAAIALPSMRSAMPFLPFVVRVPILHEGGLAIRLLKDTLSKQPQPQPVSDQRHRQHARQPQADEPGEPLRER